MCWLWSRVASLLSSIHYYMISYKIGWRKQDYAGCCKSTHQSIASVLYSTMHCVPCVHRVCVFYSHVTYAIDTLQCKSMAWYFGAVLVLHWIFELTYSITTFTCCMWWNCPIPPSQNLMHHSNRRPQLQPRVRLVCVLCVSECLCVHWKLIWVYVCVSCIWSMQQVTKTRSMLVFNHQAVHDIFLQTVSWCITLKRDAECTHVTRWCTAPNKCEY